MKSPDTKHPAEIVASDPKRDATDTVAGYDWQRWLTVLAWIDLQAEQSLWIEWAEDYTITHPQGDGLTVQAKHLAAPVTLGQERIQKLLSAAWGRPDSVQTWIWTSAVPGNERGLPFGEPGIDHWKHVAGSDSSPDLLRQFLLHAPNIDAVAKARIAKAGDDTFRQMLQQIGWAVGEADVAGLRDKTCVRVEARMDALGIRNAGLSREVTAALLFDAVARRSIMKPVTERRLTRTALDQNLAQWNLERIAGAAPEILEKIGGDRLAIQRVDRSPPRQATPWSFSWFVYTTKTIPLIGRTGELASIRAFAEDPAPFLWWAVGGPGGVGKSRLTQEAMIDLGEAWTTGFARVDQLSQLRSSLTLQTGNFMFAIDYAAIDSKAVADFLLACIELGAATRRIRILLIDRHPNVSAEWWTSLFPPFSAQAAKLEETLSGPPLTLEPMLSVDRELLQAWLDAAGEAAQLDDETWRSVSTLCGGNPLMLGFAAAGVVRGDTRFESVGDLLSGLSQREWTKIRERSPDRTELALATDMIATATLSRGPIYEYADHDLLALTMKGPDGARHVLMVTTKNGLKRFPTFAELEAGLLPDGIIEPQLERRRMYRQAMSELVDPYPISDAFEVARKVFGLEIQVQPDLLGEYFLAESWKAPKTGAPSLVMPRFDENHLDRQLRAAWRVAPKATLFTFEQLRRQPWAVDGFLRAIERLVLCVAAEDEDDDIETLSVCLYNASTRVGGAKASLHAREAMFRALDVLAHRRPGDEGVIRRRILALKQLINMLEGAPRDEARRVFLADAREHMALLLSKDDGYELHIMDVIDDFARAALATPDPDDVLIALSALEALIDSGVRDVEVDQKTGALYFSVSSACGRPEIPVEEAMEATLGFARAVLPALVSGVQKFTAIIGPKAPLRASEKSLVNASLAALKLGDHDEVRRLVEIVLTLSDENELEEIDRTIALHALHNMALVEMGCRDDKALTDTLLAIFAMVLPVIQNAETAVTCLQILEKVALHSLVNGGETPNLLFSVAVRVPWPVEVLPVRCLLFKFVRAIQLGFGPSAARIAVDEARDANSSPDAVAFLELAWTNFEPDAAEGDEEGLVQYLDAVARADLGQDFDEHLAAAVAAFWAAHGREPVVPDSPLLFWLRPEEGGVRVTLGPDRHDPTRWLFFSVVDQPPG